MAKVRFNVGACNGPGGRTREPKKSIKKQKPLAPSEKSKYAKAVFAMGIALSALKKVGCDQPDMTFEVQYQRKPQRAKASRRRRR